ncbi:MAG: YeeE/YedE family protein [Oligoflexia bacterium]|nr:YeeE/YedE family protein [Oligoflexia bacterium]MBF0364559.1 YeeE/YedE family protein [Oligoflexia bacterium]
MKKQIALQIFILVTLTSNVSAQINNQIGGSWSPYLTGFFIGTLLLLTLYFSNKPIGVSSFYATLAGMIGKRVSPSHILKLDYYKNNPPEINWEFVFVISTVVGSFIAAYFGEEFNLSWVPQLWSNTFGTDSITRYGIIAFIGGIFMSFGARLADGCTSGHGISGTSQLNVASWISVICFFISGMIAIRFIY